MTHTQRTLIVGSAGTATAFGVIRSVRDHWGQSVRIIATDVNPPELVAASQFSDHCLSIPLARSSEFASALAELAGRWGDAYYLPIHDEEIERCTTLAPTDWPAALTLLAPSSVAVSICNDKLKTHAFLHDNGFPSPHTVEATRTMLSTLALPVMLKPRRGVGGRGVRPITRPEQFDLVEDGNWIFQEALEEPEITIDGFLARDGRLFRAVCRERLEVKDGVCTKARIFEDDDLAAMVEVVVRRMSMHGAFCLQVMHSSSGWKITDINPRTGGGSRLSAAVGVDFMAANLADAWGEPVLPLLPRLTHPRIVVRQLVEYVTS